jgi:uncharacterized protein
VGLLPHLDAQVFKFGLGAVLVIACPAMLFAAHLPEVSLRPPAAAKAADALAGVGGGVLGGLGGFTGVVPTLWCTLRGFEKAAQRSVVQNFNLATLAVTMLAYVVTGAVSAPMWPLLPVVAAAVLVPSMIGARLYHRLSEQAFRRVVLGLLTAAGAVMLVSAAPPIHCIGFRDRTFSRALLPFSCPYQMSDYKLPARRKADRVVAIKVEPLTAVSSSLC